MEPLLFLIAGVTLVPLGRYIYSNQRHLLRHGVQTIGRLRKYRESGSLRNGRTYYAILSFKDKKGDVFEAELGYSTSWKPYAIGEEIDILYDPADPLNISPLKTPWLRALSILVECIGYGLIVYAIIKLF